MSVSVFMVEREDLACSWCLVEAAVAAAHSAEVEEDVDKRLCSSKRYEEDEDESSQ